MKCLICGQETETPSASAVPICPACQQNRLPDLLKGVRFLYPHWKRACWLLSSAANAMTPGDPQQDLLKSVILAYLQQYGHLWSGWPGAFCLRCGMPDGMEQAIADEAYDPVSKQWTHPGLASKYCSGPCPFAMTKMQTPDQED